MAELQAASAQNYQTPDLVAESDWRRYGAKYAEDYRAEGMLFGKLMLSPRPHARIAASTPAPRWRCRACTPSSPPTTCPLRRRRRADRRRAASARRQGGAAQVA